MWFVLLRSLPEMSIHSNIILQTINTWNTVFSAAPSKIAFIYHNYWQQKGSRNVLFNYVKFLKVQHCLPGTPAIFFHGVSAFPPPCLPLYATKACSPSLFVPLYNSSQGSSEQILQYNKRKFFLTKAPSNIYSQLGRVPEKYLWQFQNIFVLKIFKNMNSTQS